MNRTLIEWTWTYKPDGTWEAGFTSNPIRAFSLEDPTRKGHHCVKKWTDKS